MLNAALTIIYGLLYIIPLYHKHIIKRIYKNNKIRNTEFISPIL